MFGFGVGRIDIRLSKTVFSANEVIEGTLLLTLKKPVKARGLYAILSADQQFREQVRNQNRIEMQTVTRRIYNFQQQLDTEKEYPKTDGVKEYPFSVAIPPEASALSGIPDDPMHGFSVNIGGMQIGSGPGPVGPAQWSVEGYLDLPLAFDVKAKTSIGIQVPEPGI